VRCKSAVKKCGRGTQKKSYPLICSKDREGLENNMFLGELHKCEAIDGVSDFDFEEGGQVVVRDDLASVVRVLEVVLLEVVPGLVDDLWPRDRSRSHDLGQDGVDLDFLEEVFGSGNRFSGEKGEVSSSEPELRSLLAGPGPSVGPVEDPLSL
jgi:hypothetical protein